MQLCAECGASFEMYPVVNGEHLNLRGRLRCLDCLPLRRLKGPRKKVTRPPETKVCQACGGRFPAKMIVDGRLRALYKRRFCLQCSPFGAHNTSRTPPGTMPTADLIEHRRRKRNAKTYRSLKRRRLRRKQELVAARGGRCQDCGYSACLAALEFHHRESEEKLFGLGQFNGSLGRLQAEAEKCDLLCANCHRLRHAAAKSSLRQPEEADKRRLLKQRAVEHMGSECFACGRRGALQIFEFHHWNASEKDFGISEDGIVRSWDKTLAELRKCVMLCANCHREVHAGVRELDEGLLGLAEDAIPYAA